MSSYFCKDCGTSIQRQRLRCNSCDKKYRVKLYQGQGNPNFKNKLKFKTCATCGKDFEYRDAGRPFAKYCSKTCMWNAKLKRVLMTCKNCGCEFEAPKCQEKRRQCCSFKCDKELRYKKSIIIRKCIFCKKDFEIQGNIQNIYCSRDCYIGHFKQRYAGENNPRWNGGTITYRGPDWSSQRIKCWERDNFTCRKCGATNCMIFAHHLIPYRISKCNDLKILLTVCNSCHTIMDNEFRRIGRTHYIDKMIVENELLKKNRTVIQL